MLTQGELYFRGAKISQDDPRHDEMLEKLASQTYCAPMLLTFREMKVLCRYCGTTGKQGERCPSCGGPR